MKSWVYIRKHFFRNFNFKFLIFSYKKASKIDLNNIFVKDKIKLMDSFEIQTQFLLN